SDSTLNMQLARHSFVMQFYLRGIRVGDMLSLTEKNMEGDRLIFAENKSGSIRSIPIHAKVGAIIDRWKERSTYLIPLLKFERDKKLNDAQNHLVYKKAIESATAVINTNLKKIASIVGIKKNIT